VYAEDPDAGFLPSPGRILALRPPQGPGIRDDGWAESGTEVPIEYDSLLSKLIAWGEDRAQATARMRRALAEYDVSGVRTSLPFFRWLLTQPEFIEARFHTNFLDELLQRQAGEPLLVADPSLEEVAAIAACLIEASRPTRAEDRQSSRGRDLSGPVTQTRDWKARARREALRQ
jgi:acetyl-CoA carboxylase biotin carboxylase subunit